MKKYDHRAIERRWQKEWEKNKIYTTPDKAPGKDNFYLLVEFPYPSGNLHVGHWYAFAVPDILARMLRMQGKNVLYPIGFDAFGLPAENAAIKNKLNPRTWTEKNIAYMKNQIRSMGTMFDWSREVQTIDPAYYKWTQWQFLQFFKKGLAYQKETAVNWCPKDKTVLANEQVVNGKCERCDTEVVQKMMLQWNIKITDYADRLIDDLEKLDWPEQIKESQRNWIGRSEGAEIDFRLKVPSDTIKRFVVLHGRNGSPTSDTFPWIKSELEKLGYEVEVPSLPHAEEPNDQEQADYVEANCHLDGNTAIIGHSFGGVVAMRLLERGVKVNRVLLLSTPFSGVFNDGKVRASVTEACEKGFDFDVIRKNAKAFLIMPDERDHIVPIEDARAWTANLKGILVPGRGEVPHFSGKKEPDVLMAAVPTIRVFTTRADTLFGATYLVLAPEHPWVELALGHKTVLKNNDEVAAYVKQAGKKTELERMTEQKEKTGVELKGVRAINPATGEKIPIFVADYVLGHYGTGAIMAVPAHDERDFDFAKKFKLPIKQVIRAVFKPENKRPDSNWRTTISGFVRNDKGEVLMLKWKEYDWLTGVVGGIDGDETPAEAAVREVYEETGYRTKVVFVSPITVESHYFADHKNEWRSRIDTPVLLELERDSRDAISDEEAAKHEARWIKIDEALGMKMFKNNKLALELALGKVGAYTNVRYGEEQVLVNSGPYDGVSAEEGKKAITEAFGRKKTTYKLRDWIVSRQRYWGVPIPVVHCPKCGVQAVPDKDLPVELPEVKDYLPDGRGKSPLAKAKKWISVKCPKCKGKAERETDTLDTFVDSSWYFLRYTDPKNKKKFADAKKMGNWMPVNLYSGGAEHTTMHLLYSRFWHKALFDLGLVKDGEPYKRRMNRSLILGPDEQKMSKSRGNVIDPDEVVARLGADTVRMYLAFIGPYNEVSSFPWNPDGVVGIRRFLERVQRLSERVRTSDVRILDRVLNKAIKKVGEDIAALKFNTAVSQLMILLNAVEKEKEIGKGQWERFLKLLAPFAPHLAEELWEASEHKGSLHEEPWPVYDPELLKDETVTIAVQINGRTRGEASVATNADKSTLEESARKAVASRLEGKKIVRIVVVLGRLVNFVLEE